MDIDIDVYLGLGSNLGDKEGNLLKAVSLIDSEIEGLKVIAVSSVYITSPVGGEDQPDFLNCAVLCRYYYNAKKAGHNLSDSDLLNLLFKLKSIERLIGRIPEEKRWGARVIDIDMLLLFEAESGKKIVINLPDLKIPHAELKNRLFVLLPLLELNADMTCPVTGKSLKDVSDKLADKFVKTENGASQKIGLYGRFNESLTEITKIF